MITRRNIPWKLMTKELWPMVLVISLYSVLISLFDLKFHLENLHLPIGLVALPGALIGVLLAFRTNSCYERWWEARIIWGRIVNHSRTWVRQLIEFAQSTESKQQELDKTIRKMSLRQIAWCFSLAMSLRGEDPLAETEAFLSADEAMALGSAQNVPNAILLLQAKDLRALRNAEFIDAYQWVAMENTLTELTNCMGGCERIKNTPFPRSYGMWIHYLIYLFIMLVPFALVDMPAYALILATLPIAIGFLIIDKVATFLEEPFSHRPSSTPMLALSRTIEINVGQMLGETEIAEEMKPENGVLY